MKANLNYGTHKLAQCYGESQWWNCPPLKSAAQSADVFKKAIRLTVEQLLADPAFVHEAQSAAWDKKTYTARLLAWEDRETVAKAVAVIRRQMDVAEAAAEREAAEAAEAIRLRTLAEQPTRNDLSTAYDSCGYRQCKQGHWVNFLIREKGQVDATTAAVRGERYSSRCTFAKQESVHTITVKPDWLTRCHAIGLATINGQLVLDAQYLGITDDGEPLLAIQYVAQGRGTQLEVRSGTAFRGPNGWVLSPKKTPFVHTVMPAWLAADFVEERNDAALAAMFRLGTGCEVS